jgi:ribosomal protein S18 acetylase RimI-like enzyme
MSNGVEIKNFRPEHAARFAELNRAWLVQHELLEAADEEEIGDPKGQILDRGGEILVALLDGAVVGCGAILPHESGAYELLKLAVDSQVQGRGIGRRLVTACIDRARSRGATRMTLISSSKLQPALRLYETLGFQHRPLPPHTKYATADVSMELDLTVDERPVTGPP